MSAVSPVPCPTSSRTRALDKRGTPPEAPKKPTFPIFNRKGGVCGTSVSTFYTFSTAVDNSVDNPALLPA